jgi:hypothetical protein
MVYVTANWQVSKEHSKKHDELLKKSLEMQRNNRELWCYTESRIFKMVDEDSSIENWMYLDLYEKLDDFNGFVEAISKRMETDTELSAWRDDFLSVVVEDSWKSAIWTEEHRIV